MKLLTLSDGALAADMLILAVGVRPDSGLAREAGLNTNEHGGIVVNQHMQTSDEDIYAVGDAVEVVDLVGGQKAMMPLAGPANKQGRIAADHICGIGSSYGGTQGSAILKVFDMTAAAIRARMTALDLSQLELCYSPPYSSAKDPINMAGYVIENSLTGKVKTFHWHDVDALRRRTDVALIDVRTSIEYKGGHIGGFVNIPLDSLRGRIGEIPRDKSAYVTCQTGLRGYLAARILSQNGFESIISAVATGSTTRLSKGRKWNDPA